jgi:cytosine/adenosine deaminase-related metal-dependent hydrolase
MAERILIRGGYVLTMDSELGDQSGADVLIEGDSIVAVGHNLSAGDAEATGAGRSVPDHPSPLKPADGLGVPSFAGV